MAAAVPQQNYRTSAIQEILGTAGAAVKNAGAKATNAVTGAIGTTLTTISAPETGNYFLKVIYYFLIYTFIIFLILLLVHFTVKPIFRFIPGGKGIVPVPGTSDDQVYWNDRKKPLAKSYAPLDSDDLAQYPFDKNYTVSLDVYIRKLSETNVKNRIILIKSTKPTTSFDNNADLSGNSIEQYFNGKASIVVYLTDTNNLVVTLFSKLKDTDTTDTPFSTRPIQNIPLYTPFRLTIVVDQRTFTLYLNGKQAFQRVVPNDITSDINQRFYAPPDWAELPVKTIFLQNLHLWPRPISVTEVAEALPALARAEDFDMPAEAGGASCL